VHSDFHPTVALQGPKARFLGESAGLLPALAYNGMPVLDLVEGRAPLARGDLDPNDNTSTLVAFQRYGVAIADALADPANLPALRASAPDEAAAVARVLDASRTVVPAPSLRAWSGDVALLARYTVGAMAARDLEGSWIDPAWIAPGQGPEVAAVMAAYHAAASRDARAMHAHARAVLESRADFAPALRQQMLTMAMSGAAGAGDRAAVVALDRAFGGAFPDTGDDAEVRRFLVAWAEGS
jgi:hypothetical protein